jgi:predicted dehydrogenase
VKEVLVETDAGVAAEAAERLGWNTSATDWREVVHRDDIDIVDIVTPPDSHHAIALEAARAGRHVFVEKPITNSAAQAAELAEVAAETGVVTQVGFNYRHTQAIAFLKQLLDSGRLGAPLQFRASYLQDGGFFVPDMGWRSYRSRGGSGVTGDLGSHIIDTAEYLCGPIMRVSAVLLSRDREAAWHPENVRRAQDAVDDAGVWLAEFSSGAVGTFSASFYAPGRKNRLAFELDATAGAADFDWNRREELRLAYVDDEADHSGFRTVILGAAEHPNGWWPFAGLGTGYIEPAVTQIESLVTAILHRRSAHPDFAEAAHVQYVVEAIQRSADTGQWADVRVPERVASHV